VQLTGGMCRVVEHFSGFGFFLLLNIVRTRPAAGRYSANTGYRAYKSNSRKSLPWIESSARRTTSCIGIFNTGMELAHWLDEPFKRKIANL